MDEIEYQKMRLKRKHQTKSNIFTPKGHKNIRNQELEKTISRFLLAVIVVLLSTIYVNWSSTNKEIFRQNVFEKNLSFTKINAWYENLFGSVLPIDLNLGSNTMVGNLTNDFLKVSKYHDGVMASTSKESAIQTLNSGIVVFIGEKEHYNNTIIIQGIDGVDIWYGNVTNVSVNLYDYVEKNTLLGSAMEDHIYFVLQKEGQYLDYEEYKSQI